MSLTLYNSPAFSRSLGIPCWGLGASCVSVPLAGEDGQLHHPCSFPLVALEPSWHIRWLVVVLAANEIVCRDPVSQSGCRIDGWRRWWVDPSWEHLSVVLFHVSLDPLFVSCCSSFSFYHLMTTCYPGTPMSSAPFKTEWKITKSGARFKGTFPKIGQSCNFIGSK